MCKDEICKLCLNDDTDYCDNCKTEFKDQCNVLQDPTYTFIDISLRNHKDDTTDVVYAPD